MASSAHDAYLESKVLTADPLELVRMLYRLAMDRIRDARQYIEAGDAGARSKAISTASEALAELGCSLDYQAGGELSRRLAQLYEYMQWRLVEANFHQSAEPLNEVLSLLSTLSEAWQEIKPEPRAAAPDAPPNWYEYPSTESAGQPAAAECWTG
jgi:flagellar secretion chaperone FliS